MQAPTESGRQQKSEMTATGKLPQSTAIDSGYEGECFTATGEVVVNDLENVEI